MTQHLRLGAAPDSETESVVTRYYSDVVLPKPLCHAGLHDSVPFSATLEAAASAMSDPAFQGEPAQPTVSMQGARLPSRLALLITGQTTRTFPGMMGATGFAVEVGHIRTISSDDPIFSVPPDFKPSEPPR